MIFASTKEFLTFTIYIIFNAALLFFALLKSYLEKAKAVVVAGVIARRSRFWDRKRCRNSGE